LVEGGPEENFLQYLFDMESPRYLTCDKVEAELEEDGLNGLRHLTFKETKGERDIQESPSIASSHHLPVKLRKQNVGMEHL